MLLDASESWTRILVRIHNVVASCHLAFETAAIYAVARLLRWRRRAPGRRWHAPPAPPSSPCTDVGVGISAVSLGTPAVNRTRRRNGLVSLSWSRNHRYLPRRLLEQAPPRQHRQLDYSPSILIQQPLVGGEKGGQNCRHTDEQVEIPIYIWHSTSTQNLQPTLWP